jgi:uncharacterized membrane protein YcaP (DUF421 family)
MNFHEFVTAVIMGAIAANLAFNEKIKVMHLIISLIVFTGTSYLLSKLNLKSRKIRLMAEGSPTVLIEGGRILENNLAKNKLTLDSLNQMLRQKDIFNMEEVEYVVLEVNGQVSVMKKANYRTATVQDVNRKVEQNLEQMPVELIMDGQMLHKNLKLNGISDEELFNKLESLQKNVSDVFYAVKGSDGRIYFDYYEDQIKHPIDVE